MSCWQSDVERRGDRPQRLDPPRPAASAVTTAPASSAGVAARISPREAAPTRCPDRPTRWRHRETPPGRPTWTVRSAVPMSTPSSRLVLVTTALSSPRLQRGLDLAAAVGVERRVVRARRLDAARLAGRPAASRLVPEVVGELLGERPGCWRRRPWSGWPSDRLAEPAEQPAIGQAAMRAPRPASISDSTSSSSGGVPVGQGGLDHPAGPRRADQEPRDRLGGAAGRRQADAARVAARPGREPFERDGEVGPALRRARGRGPRRRSGARRPASARARPAG